MKKYIIIFNSCLILLTGCGGGDTTTYNIYGNNNSVGNQQNAGIIVDVPIDVDVETNNDNSTGLTEITDDSKVLEQKQSEQIPQPISDSTPQLSEKPESTPEPTPEQISIRDVSEFYSDGIEHRKSTITDNIGESYEGFTYMSAGDFFVELEGSVVYRNDNQYNRFWGRVIISQDEKNDKDCGWIKIYGDDNLLLDTGTMGRGMVPIDFDFDISMYSEIKIDFKDGEWSNDSLRYPQCYLVNTYFEVK